MQPLRCLGLALLLFGQAYSQESPAPSPIPAKPAALLRTIGKAFQLIPSCGPEQINELGLKCNVQEPCPVYLELSSLAAIGNRLVLTGNAHTSANTLHSVALTSDDRGVTWTEPIERIRFASLDEVQFADFASGWISGETLFPTPRDPFLFLTLDGGKTWRRRPIEDEGGPGAIEQFFFTSRDQGSLILDRRAGAEGGRYALYETSTGGENWSLHQLSERPLKLKTTDTPTGWRLRTDSRSKSYYVEVSSTDGWHAVSSFLVNLGNCRLEEDTAPPASNP